MAPLTTAHPSVRVEVLDRLEISPRRVLFDVELPSLPRTNWSQELGGLPNVESVDLIDANAQVEIYRVLFTGRTFLPLAKRLRILRRFPFPIQNGVASWLVVGPDSRVRSLLRSLQRSRIAFRVDSIQRGLRRNRSSPLTNRQREILRQAVVEGYFEVPRRVSLTELAARIGVASSTLSVTLAVIERKIIEPFEA
ncbi:MAG: helix-turn-helix domain-containing protein [Thermoplasmata archaeon]